LGFKDFNLGVVWAVWHLPLFFFGGTDQHNVVGFLMLRFWLFMIGVVALSVAFTWIHNGSGGTILASIMLQSRTNSTLQSVEGTLRTDAFFYTVVLWVFVVLITLIWGAKIPHPTLKSPRQKTRNAVNERDSPVSSSMVSIRRRASVTSTSTSPWTLLRRAAARM
jgi:hypothetical protein